MATRPEQLYEHCLKLAWSRRRCVAISGAICLDSMTRRDGTSKGLCAPTASTAQPTSCPSNALTALSSCCGTTGIPRTSTA